MAALGKEKEKDKEKEKGEKEGGTAKRKEREDNFPVHEDDIPRAIITRMVKAKLPPGTSIANEAKSALARAGRIFILYLAATAHDSSAKSGRSTIMGPDVLAAIEETEFTPFLEPLTNALTTFRAASDKKRAKSKKDEKEAERREEEIDIDDDEDDEKDEDFDDD